MKIKNIILTLCCITLGLVLNVGTAFAYGDGVSVYGPDDYWLQYSYSGKTYYISKQDYDSLGGNASATQLVSQYQRTNTSTTRPGTDNGSWSLGEGVSFTSDYKGYVQLNPGNAGNTYYMTKETYEYLRKYYGISNASEFYSHSANLLTDSRYVVDIETLKERVQSTVEQGFEALTTENFDKGYVHFSATPPSLTDLANSAKDNSIYFYCDIGPKTGQYGHAENYSALYYYIKNTTSDYPSYEFAKTKIDSTDGVDAAMFSIEVSSSNICSVSTMMGVVKDTLLFTQGEIGIINGLLPTVIPIAYCLMVLYFVLEIANIASRDITNISAEIYIKAFAKLIIAVLIIGNSYKLIIYGANLANGLTDMLLTAANSDLNLPALSGFAQIAASKDTDGIMAAIKMVLGLFSGLINLILIPFNFIVIIIISVQCYSRKIEFLLRSLFLPMAIADIAGKGLESSGMRYLRKLVAVGFHGGGIIGLTYVAGELQQVAGSGTDIIIVLALLGSIGLVKTAINEMMGV